MDCTRKKIKTQTTNLTLPKDLWRTLEAAKRHHFHLAKQKVNNCFLSQLIDKPLKEFEKKKGFTLWRTTRVLCSRTLVT